MRLIVLSLIPFFSILCIECQLHEKQKDTAQTKTHYKLIKSILGKEDTLLIEQMDLNYNSFIVERIVHKQDEFSFQIFKQKQNRLLPASHKIETGSFYDTILIKDYNFDGVPDVDLITRPANRSGDNAINHIFLRKQDTFELAKKSRRPLCAYITPVKAEKALYGRILNSNGDFIFRKLIWNGNQLIISEEVTSNCKESCAERVLSKYVYKNGERILVKEGVTSSNDYIKIDRGWGMDAKIIYWDRKEK